MARDEVKECAHRHHVAPSNVFLFGWLQRVTFWPKKNTLRIAGEMNFNHSSSLSAGHSRYHVSRDDPLFDTAPVMGQLVY
jgi:hypothetical protein